jgi:cysteine-rich repeat protein
MQTGRLEFAVAVLTMLALAGTAHALVCGDGILDLTEQCDDGNVIDGDCCSSLCQFESAGSPCNDGNACTQTDQCDSAGACTGGNVVICTALDQCHIVGSCDPGTGLCSNPSQPDETSCDDGNVCTSNDQCVSGFCQGTFATCGDGVAQGSCGEQCDDGNAINGDGCDDNCTFTACGNGILTGTEECDDGNNVNSDGCSASCLREFLNPIPAAGDLFGSSLATLGPNLVVGTPLHDAPNALNTGVAYVLSGNTAVLLRTLQNPTPDPGDEFGFAVATVGTNVVIGAPFDDSAGEDAGAVYVFDGASGTLIRTLLNPAPANNRRFGWTIAAVDSNVLISAPQDDSGAGGGGAAYLYDVVTGVLRQVFLNPAPAAGDDFGFAVAAAGSNVIIGAPRHDTPATQFEAAKADTGAAYVFDGSTGALLRTLLSPDQHAGDEFGWSVAGVGANVLVGDPNDHNEGAALLFDTTTGTLRHTLVKSVRTPLDAFGYRVAALGNDKALVSALGDDTGTLNAGAVYVFSTVDGSLLETFQKAAPHSDDDFGRAVVSLGPTRVFVGAPMDDTVTTDAGAVYSFEDTSCGIGTIDPGEQCDDGNRIDGDGCDSNCTFTTCGNGVVTAGEQCDDGNTTAGDGCGPSCQLEGICGDGVVTAGEQCDDGNLVNGDGCDANCTLTSCGNGIITAGEQCDEGVGNGIDLCCSTICHLIDSDGDAICDRDDNCPTIANPSQVNTDGDIFGDTCDLCPGDTDNDSDGDGYCIGTVFNPPALGGGDPCSRPAGEGAWIKPAALFGRLNLPHNDDKLRLKGRFVIGSDVPILAPNMNGVHLRVVDNARRIIVDERIAGGELSDTALNGWRASGSPPVKWIYLDKNLPPVHNGIRKIVLRDLSRFTPGLTGVIIQGKGGDYRLIPGQEPVSVALELNETALPPGGTPGRDQCGEARFNASEPPTCGFNGSSLLCK